jgi:hypothetical protein
MLDSQAQMLSILEGGGGLVLALIFARSAVPKLLHPRRFTRVVLDYDVLPRSLSIAFAPTVIAAELLIAVSILLGVGIQPLLGMMAATVMAGSFLLITALQLHRGRTVVCGCFSLDERISSRSIVRLVLLLSLSSAVLVMAIVRTAPTSVATALTGAPNPVAVLGVTMVSVVLLALGKGILAIYDTSQLSFSGESGGRPAP